MNIPLTFLDLINIAGNDNICNQQLKRKPGIQEEYDKFRKFNNFDLKIDNLKIDNLKIDNLKIDNYLIKLNDFPYNVEDNVTHYILWLDNFEYTHDEIQQIINFEFKEYPNIVWFINSKMFRSIHSIYHVHIFVN